MAYAKFSNVSTLLQKQHKPMPRDHGDTRAENFEPQQAFSVHLF